MANPGNDQPEELDHHQDVTSEQENMDTTPPSPCPTPTVQGGASEISKGQLLDFCRGPYSCRLCPKGFGSQNAVNAHMKAHKSGKEKPRVAIPPPSVTRHSLPSPKRESDSGGAGSDANLRDTLQEELAAVLLNLAQQVLPASSSSLRPHGLEIDLNKPPPKEKEDGDEGENIIDAGGPPII